VGEHFNLLSNEAQAIPGRCPDGAGGKFLTEMDGHLITRLENCLVQTDGRALRHLCHISDCRIYRPTVSGWGNYRVLGMINGSYLGGFKGLVEHLDHCL